MKARRIRADLSGVGENTTTHALGSRPAAACDS